MANQSFERKDEFKTCTTSTGENENDDPDDKLQIMIDRVNAVTNKVSITVQNQDASAVVDTAAEVTVMKSDTACRRRCHFSIQ